ncbi:CDP-archaeol synthase [Proteobacteria bacterium 005FR1]|nr:CDP-archaeol synthase [Proteobacteria bacterium 005FR1]
MLIVANGAPVVLGKFMGRAADWRIDGGIVLPDGRPLFGATKTWRGLVAAILATGFAGWLLGFGWLEGALIGVGAMVGDLLSSFLKRRLGLDSSAKAVFLDQVPEALIPVCILNAGFGYGWAVLIPAAIGFVVVDITLSPLLYRLGLRRVPH